MHRRGRVRAARAGRTVAERASGRRGIIVDAGPLMRAARIVGKGAKLPRSKPRYAADTGGTRRARAPLRAPRSNRRSQQAFSRERRPRVGATGIGLKARPG